VIGFIGACVYLIGLGRPIGTTVQPSGEEVEHDLSTHFKLTGALMVFFALTAALT
jgi:hypothetical protein